MFQLIRFTTNKLNKFYLPNVAIKNQEIKPNKNKSNKTSLKIYYFFNFL